MNLTKKALFVLAVASLGLWGCAKGANNGAAQNERIKSLEQRNARLEQDFRALAQTRDELRKKLAWAEEQQARLRREVDQLKSVVKERDELRQQLEARISERDHLQAQYEQFRRQLKELLGQAEAAVTKPAATLTSYPGSL
ncbi:MAG: hypothetical protein NZ700_14260 [Gemmataceae bacterium]|nr:hypothetical protein [Gemmataceae bacterium]MDW8264588.1 hypothetical protein [Gemmataceae bacterium]